MFTKDQLTTIHEALEYTRSLTHVQGFDNDCAELVPVVRGLIDNPPDWVAFEAAAIATPEQVQLRLEHEHTIEAARSNYASNDINISDTPLVSVAEGGVWISAQVWVALDDDDDTACPTCGQDGGTSCGSPTCGLLQGA